MNLIEEVQSLSQGQYWLFTALSLAICVAGFFFAFRFVARARLIEDTPTARIRSAHQGYLELDGKAAVMDGEPIVAPLSGMHCCWYRFQIDQQSDNNWRRSHHGSSDDLFIIEDETGQCLVDPDGARVTPSAREVWYGDSPTPSLPTIAAKSAKPSLVARLGSRLTSNLGDFNRYRYTEERIDIGSPLYIIGQFKSLDDIDHRANRRELTGAILREWKQDQARLLQRFDHNRDGTIDDKEWQQARQAAGQEAAEQYREQMQHQQLHTIGQPRTARRPYLISTLPQFSLVRRFRLLAAAGIAGFFIGGSGFVLLIGAGVAG